MWYTSKRLRLLLFAPPLFVRLGIIVVSFLFALLLYLLLFLPSHNGSILVVPIVFAAWFFRFRGLLLTLFLLTLSLLLSSLLGFHTFTLTPAGIITFLIGFLLLFTQGTVVALFRSFIERFDAVQAAVKQKGEIIYQERQQLYVQKEQIMLHINHELKTPLTEVYGYLQLLRDQQAQLDHTMRTLFLDHAIHGCEELQTVIAKIMRVQPGSGKVIEMKIEEVVVAPVIEEVCTRFDGELLAAHPTEVNLPANLVVMADRLALQEVLYQLLTNAYTYTPPATPVVIGADYQRGPQEQPFVCLHVKDTGPGIPPTEQTHLFESLTRLKQHNSGDIRGMGLGLYHCRQLVEAMGGRIWVESSGVVGEGSCFSFQLPLGG